MKVVIQQVKCKGFINLLPIVNGVVLHDKIYSVFPSYYKNLGKLTEELKAEFK